MFLIVIGGGAYFGNFVNSNVRQKTLIFNTQIIRKPLFFIFFFIFEVNMKTGI